METFDHSYVFMSLTGEVLFMFLLEENLKLLNALFLFALQQIICKSVLYLMVLMTVEL